MNAPPTELSVPVIRLADSARLEGDPQLARQLVQACEDWGFFQLLGHGVPTELSRNTFAAAEQFFAQPQDAKRQILRSAENPWGYFDAEFTKNALDWKEIVDIGPARGKQQPQWPLQLPEFRPAMDAYARSVDALARRLTDLILQTLSDSGPGELTGFQDHTSFLRLNNYPVCPSPAPPDVPLDRASGDAVSGSGHLGISHHTDAGALTVLQQWGPAGLQVLHEDQWHTVDVLPDALVINIGDIVQVWSNDRYRAPVHRVLANASAVRSSAAYFFNPDFSYSYAPLAGTGNPAYRPINWGEFRAGRSAGDYANLGEEIQISQFRV